MVNPPNEFHGQSRSEEQVIHNFIHPTASIGDGSKMWHNAVIQADVKIGRGCSVGSCSEISRGCEIGDLTRIGFGVITAPGMKIGTGVFIGPNVTFCDDPMPVAGNTSYEPKPPKVNDRASIGAGAIIMPGVVIGEGATVGAGCLVTKHVTPFTIVRNRIDRVDRYA